MPSSGMALIETILTTENLKSIERDLPNEIGKKFKQFESKGGPTVNQAMWVKLLFKAVIAILWIHGEERFLECFSKGDRISRHRHPKNFYNRTKIQKKINSCRQ